ncbi:hypothetical protein [Geobacillus virus E2]|uniref:hypothetical protein n=1 Tax=Geobacillus virus E2 TaxID=447909 RepID=UPI00015367F0|nr:hypothetical protein GBVE2_p28 [Geobacillus virus E2]ABI36846.1 hypothetical protein [Geobacillus virus E2]
MDETKFCSFFMKNLLTLNENAFIFKLDRTKLRSIDKQEVEKHCIKTLRLKWLGEE